VKEKKHLLYCLFDSKNIVGPCLKKEGQSSMFLDEKYCEKNEYTVAKMGHCHKPVFVDTKIKFKKKF